jgi:hypothetical protein
MNNYFKDCPAKMDDSRQFTDWRTATRREEYVKHINGIVRDDEYRVFLQKNAEKIMNGEWSYLKKNANCWKNGCTHNYPTRMDPAKFVEERSAHDEANKSGNGKFQCAAEKDYRLH